MKCATIILLCGCDVGGLITLQGGVDRATVGITRQDERSRGDEAGSAGVGPSIRGSHTGEGEGVGVGGASASGCGPISEGGAVWSSPHHLHSHTIHCVLLQGNGAGEGEIGANQSW